jgi:P-type Mg2+ transporter
VAFLDPPKETAREAIAALREYGIDIKIITGGNEVVTRKIWKLGSLSTNRCWARMWRP